VTPSLSRQICEPRHTPLPSSTGDRGAPETFARQELRNAVRPLRIYRCVAARLSGDAHLRQPRRFECGQSTVECLGESRERVVDVFAIAASAGQGRSRGSLRGCGDARRRSPTRRHPRDRAGTGAGGSAFARMPAERPIARSRENRVVETGVVGDEILPEIARVVHAALEVREFEVEDMARVVEAIDRGRSRAHGSMSSRNSKSALSSGSSSRGVVLYPRPAR